MAYKPSPRIRALAQNRRHFSNTDRYLRPQAELEAAYFSKYLRPFRKSKNMTQQDVAYLMGYEKGNKYLSTVELHGNIMSIPLLIETLLAMGATFRDYVEFIHASRLESDPYYLPGAGPLDEDGGFYTHDHGNRGINNQSAKSVSVDELDDIFIGNMDELPDLTGNEHVGGRDHRQGPALTDDEILDIILE